MFHKCDYDCKEYREKDHPIKKRWVIGEYTFRRCPLVYTDAEAQSWIEDYRRYKTGILPASGGFYDQTFKFKNVIEYIESLINETRGE